MGTLLTVIKEPAHVWPLAKTEKAVIHLEGKSRERTYVRGNPPYVYHSKELRGESYKRQQVIEPTVGRTGVGVGDVTEADAGV